MALNKCRIIAAELIVAASLSGCDNHGQDRMETSQQQQRIAALRAAYEAFNRGDIDAAVVALDPQVEWSEPPEFPGGGIYYGREGARKYLTQSRAAWAEVVSEPEQFIPVGERVVVFVYARVRPHNSHDWRETRLADVFTFQDGSAIEMRAFADRQEALRWAEANASNR